MSKTSHLGLLSEAKMSNQSHGSKSITIPILAETPALASPEAKANDDICGISTKCVSLPGITRDAPFKSEGGLKPSPGSLRKPELLIILRASKIRKSEIYNKMVKYQVRTMPELEELAIKNGLMLPGPRRLKSKYKCGNRKKIVNLKQTTQYTFPWANSHVVGGRI